MLPALHSRSHPISSPHLPPNAFLQKKHTNSSLCCKHSEELGASSSASSAPSAPADTLLQKDQTDPYSSFLSRSQPNRRDKAKLARIQGSC